MDQEVSSMIVARDQFLSWKMISARQSDWTDSTSAAARYSFFQARNAIYHSLNLLDIEPGSHVLAPSYICRAAIDPLIAYGVDVGFYAVTRDCSIDLRDLEARITPRTEAVLIVHYFGFPQPLHHLRRLCNTHGLALIEDCAHVLSGEVEGKPLGTVGDAAVFSWRKFLPIYDGAELVMNRRARQAGVHLAKEDGLFTLKVAANMLDASLVRTRQPLLKLAYRGIRAGEVMFRKCANWYLRKSPMMQAETNTVFFDMQSVNWPMSRLSRWTKSHSNIGSIIAARRRNYETLLEELSCLKDVRPLFPRLPSTICPWVFPVLFADLTDAHLLLRSRGIPAVTWGGVRHPQTTQGNSIDADFLYENLVFLPVHQCLRDRDIVNIARTAKELYVRRN
jgi:dTDP-4-amino-4,6-dideoxygalactose transaminase